MRRLLLSLAAFAAFVLLASACGGADIEVSQNTEPGSSTDEPAPEDGVVAGPEEPPIGGPVDSPDLPDSYAMEVSDSPTGLAVSDDAVWVSNGDADTVSRIDRRTGAVVITAVGSDPEGLAVGFDAVWVTNNSDDTVSRLDSSSGTVTDTIDVGERPIGVAVSDDAVWVAAERDDTVVRIDPTSRAVTDIIAVGADPIGITATAGAIWVANNDDNTVSRIDPDTRTVTDTIVVDDEPRGIAATAGAVWVDSYDGTVIRIDPDTRAVTDIIPVDGDGDEVNIGASDGSVWLVTPGNNAVPRIDPATRTVAVTVTVDGAAAVAESRGSLWVVTVPEDYAVAVAQGEDPIEPLPDPGPGAVRRIDPATLVITLEGHILNSVDDSPFRGVTVVPCLQTSDRRQCVIDKAQTTGTDADGAFSVTVAEPGRYVVLYALDGVVRPTWDDLQFGFETGGPDALAALTEFFGDLESVETPFVRTNLDDEGATSFGGYFYSLDLGLGSVWVESAPVAVTVTPAGGFIDLRVWDRVGSPEDFEPVVASTDDPGRDDDDSEAVEEPATDKPEPEENSATDLQERFIENFFVYPAMRDAVPDDELACIAELASERLSEAEIDQLAGPSPSATLAGQVAQLLDDCLSDQTMQAVLSAALIEGTDVTATQADCLANALVGLDSEDFVTLIVVDDAAELPAELFDQLVTATQGCLG